MIQGMDAPVSPGSRGYMAYCWKKESKTESLRQEFKTRVLTLTKQDVINAVKQHIKPQFEESTTVVFAGKELIEKENLTLKKEGFETLPIYS